MRIGIAGAGLIGRLLAWQCARRGDEVDIFERDVAGAHSSAAWVAASMLAPWSEAVAAEREVLAPGVDALREWPALLDALVEDGAQRPAWQSGGTLVLAHPNDAGLLKEFERNLRRLPVAADQQHLTETQIADLEPELGARFQQALLLPAEASLDNRALLTALDDFLADRVRWHRGSEVIEVAAGRIRTASDKYQFDVAVDCRGLGARDQLPALRGVRGEIIRVHAAEVSLSRTLRLMHPRYQLYISPRADHHYVVGATEIESDCEAPVTVRSALELLSALYTVHPGFAEANILEMHARCRPAFADNLPRVETCAGMVSVNGLHRHGYLLAPVLLRQAMQAIAAAAGDGQREVS